MLIKKSKIDGSGVFASRDFKAGEIVLKWNVSNKITKNKIKHISSSDKKYISYFDGSCFLMQPPERFVNHSCDPNTFPKDFCDIAKRDIKKGEEITTNYLDVCNEINMKCNCGSKNCKGVIKK